MLADHDLVIRIADERDVASLSRFGEAHIRPHYQPLIGEAAATAQIRDWWNVQVITRAVIGREMIIAEMDDRLVGVAQVSVRSDPPTIYKLYLQPACRGRGIGRVLLDAVVRSLPPESVRIAVEHFAANERAGAFYEREGFMVDHVSEDPSGDPALAIVWRVRMLA